MIGGVDAAFFAVSTHSRLKAAGSGRLRACTAQSCFNTQPPEGGWHVVRLWRLADDVSTHSRLKAAGTLPILRAVRHCVSTHSRLKAAGSHRVPDSNTARSFNTQPPEGGWGKTGF